MREVGWDTVKTLSRHAKEKVSEQQKKISKLLHVACLKRKCYNCAHMTSVFFFLHNLCIVVINSHKLRRWHRYVVFRAMESCKVIRQQQKKRYGNKGFPLFKHCFDVFCLLSNKTCSSIICRSEKQQWHSCEQPVTMSPASISATFSVREARWEETVHTQLISSLDRLITGCKIIIQRKHFRLECAIVCAAACGEIY